MNITFTIKPNTILVQFDLEYSGDDGATWQIIVAGHQIELSIDQLAKQVEAVAIQLGKNHLRTSEAIAEAQALEGQILDV